MSATLQKAQAIVRSHIKGIEPLEFRKLSPYALTCQCCGQFYVCKYVTQEKTRYEVWFRPTNGPIQSALQLRTNLPTGEDAKKWASAIAQAYKRGTLSLKPPPTPQEIQKQREEIDRLRASA